MIVIQIVLELAIMNNKTMFLVRMQYLGQKAGIVIARGTGVLLEVSV